MMTERITADHLSFLMDMIDREVERDYANTQLWLVFDELDRARANEDTGELEAARLQLQAAHAIIYALLDYTSIRLMHSACVMCGHRGRSGHEDDCPNKRGAAWLQENEVYSDE